MSRSLVVNEPFELKRDVALIPRVAIHLNRETNSGVKYDPARDLVALYAAGTGSGSTAPGTFVLGYGSLADDACPSVGETLKKLCTAARDSSLRV